MDDESQNQLTRRGFPIFLTNPSLTGSLPSRKTQQTTKSTTAYLISPDSGEVLGKGAFGFVEENEVDSEQFLKVYLAGIKQFAQLSKAGARLFEFLYHELSGRNGKNKDTVTMNYQIVQLWDSQMTRPTYFRGLKELLEKEFLFRSMGADNYFVNIKYLFNGNRLLVVQSYQKKKTTTQKKISNNKENKNETI